MNGWQKLVSYFDLFFNKENESQSTVTDNQAFTEQKGGQAELALVAPKLPPLLLGRNVFQQSLAPENIHKAASRAPTLNFEEGMVKIDLNNKDFSIRRRLERACYNAHIRPYLILNDWNNSYIAYRRRRITAHLSDLQKHNYPKESVRQIISFLQGHDSTLNPYGPQSIRHAPWIPVSERLIQKFRYIRMDTTAVINHKKGENKVHVYSAGTDFYSLEHLLLDFEKGGAACQTYPLYEDSFLDYLYSKVVSVIETNKVNVVSLHFSGHSLGAALTQLYLSSLLKCLHGYYVSGSPYERFAKKYPLLSRVRHVEIDVASALGIDAKRAHQANEQLKEIKRYKNGLTFAMNIIDIKHDLIKDFLGQEVIFRKMRPEHIDICMAKGFLTPDDRKRLNSYSLLNPVKLLQQLRKSVKAHSAKISQNIDEYDIVTNESVKGSDTISRSLEKIRL